MTIRKGKIVNFIGSWGSGMGQLVMEDFETGEVEFVPCENGPTVRALEDAFGGVITPEHTANGDGYKGKEVFWQWDEMGLMMAGFMPVEMAPDSLIEDYENQKAESGRPDKANTRHSN